MALYLDKIAENEQKIQKLEESIKRDTAKKKKLTEEKSVLLICRFVNSITVQGVTCLIFLQVNTNANVDASENNVTEKMPGQASFFNED